VANVHLTYLFRLSTTYHESSTWAHYAAMCKLSAASFAENLDGLEKQVVLTCEKPQQSYLEMFSRVMHVTRELWSEGHTVLCTDVDVICVRPTELFRRFDDHLFRMFWPSFCPPPDSVKPYDIPIEFNAGVRFFPKDMPSHLWTVAFDLIKRYKLSEQWAVDQAILNLMLYSQEEVAEDPTQLLANELNWCPHLENVVPPESAHILHLHGSRGPRATLEAMQAFSEPYVFAGSRVAGTGCCKRAGPEESGEQKE
jgi:hypothetical protein